MKLQVLVASFPLTALVLACASAGVGVESAGVPVSPLRRQLIHAKHRHRRMKKKNKDEDSDDSGKKKKDNAQESGGDGEATEKTASSEVGYADGKNMTNTTTSQAMLLFETAPSEWNSGQWVMFTVFGGVLGSFIVLSTYYCIKRKRHPVLVDGCTVIYDDDEYLLERSHSGSIRKWFGKH